MPIAKRCHFRLAKTAQPRRIKVHEVTTIRTFAINCVRAYSAPEEHPPFASPRSCRERRAHTRPSALQTNLKDGAAPRREKGRVRERRHSLWRLDVSVDDADAVHVGEARDELARHEAQHVLGRRVGAEALLEVVEVAAEHEVDHHEDRLQRRAPASRQMGCRGVRARADEETC
eukprot:2314959-Pleurochrysis_carterae.AAC.2